jgi:hypothetical protein
MKSVISFIFLSLVISFAYSQEVPFDQLNLTGSALYAATKIKERFPNVIFTGGIRTLDSQARAVAKNIYTSQNSSWVGATYRDSAFIRKLNQEIINNWASIKGSESLILQKINEIFRKDNAGAKSMSKHLSGYAFDLRVNCVNYNELNSFVRTLPGFHQFLTQEGGLAVWHLEFNEAPIPANNSTSRSNFQATHKVVTNDGSRLRLRNAPGFDASQIGSLEYGSYVRVLNTGASAVDSDGYRGNWTYISTPDGRTGWCFGAYLQTNIETQTDRHLNDSKTNYRGGETFTIGPNKTETFRLHDGNSIRCKLFSIGLGDLTLEVSNYAAYPIAVNWQLSADNMVPLSGSGHLSASNERNSTYRFTNFRITGQPARFYYAKITVSRL